MRAEAEEVKKETKVKKEAHRTVLKQQELRDATGVCRATATQQDFIPSPPRSCNGGGALAEQAVNSDVRATRQQGVQGREGRRR